MFPAFNPFRIAKAQQYEHLLFFAGMRCELYASGLGMYGKRFIERPIMAEHEKVFFGNLSSRGIWYLR